MEEIKNKLKGKTYLFEYGMNELKLNSSKTSIKELNHEKIVHDFYKSKRYFVVKSASRQFQFSTFNLDFIRIDEHKKSINNYLIKNFNLQLTDLETQGILDFIVYKFNEKGKIIDLFFVEVKAEGQGLNANQIKWILNNKNIPIKIVVIGKQSSITR